MKLKSLVKFAEQAILDARTPPKQTKKGKKK